MHASKEHSTLAGLFWYCLVFDVIGVILIDNWASHGTHMSHNFLYEFQCFPNTLTHLLWQHKPPLIHVGPVQAARSPDPGFSDNPNGCYLQTNFTISPTSSFMVKTNVGLTDLQWDFAVLAGSRFWQSELLEQQVHSQEHRSSAVLPHWLVSESLVEALLDSGLVRKTACLGASRRKEGHPEGAALTWSLSCN